MSRLEVKEPPPERYEGWLAIAEAMGCHERTARRYSRHKDLRRRVKVAYDPYGNVFAKHDWIVKWVGDNTTTNKEVA